MDTHISSARQMPPVEITIAVNQSNFTIRIADRGRGKSASALNFDSSSLREKVVKISKFFILLYLSYSLREHP